MGASIDTSRRGSGAGTPSKLSDHVVTTSLEVKPDETVVGYAQRLVAQAFYPRAGMSDAELGRLDRALEYIGKYSARFPVEIVRMNLDELQETQRDIAAMFEINPRSRTLAA